MVRLFTNLGIIPAAGPVVYAGPGDIVSGATAWWGLRAYMLSTVGSNALRLREDGGNTQQDFTTITGGGLDLSGISSFKGANNLFVVTMYDQTGNGRDVTQATAANQPPFVLSGLGSLPVMRPVAASAHGLQGANYTQVQPLSSSFAAKRTTVGAGVQIMVGSGSGAARLGFSNAADLITLANGAVLNVAATDNNWYAVNALSNGASSNLNVNGTDNAGDGGTSGFDGTALTFIYPHSSFGLTGDIVEGGVWGTTSFTPTQCANLSANQRAYWGF